MRREISKAKSEILLKKSRSSPFALLISVQTIKTYLAEYGFKTGEMIV